MAVAISREDITTYLDGHATKADDMAANIEVLLESVMDAAEVLQRANEDGKVFQLLYMCDAVPRNIQVDTCKNATKELLGLEARIRGSAAALKEVAKGYDAPLEGNTDFKGLLEEAEAAAGVHCEPEEHEHYKALEERLWNVHHPNEPMPGTEEAFGGDDDIIIEGSGRDISKNPKCPITGLEMLNLKEPVVDEMGFVYEKEGIYDWLSKQPGGGRNPVRAPIAAVRHSITKAGLKRAIKVIRAQKQKQRMPQTQAAAQEDDILDV